MESLYYYLAGQIHFYTLMLADMFNMASMYALAINYENSLESVSMVYGWAMLLYGASGVFPWYFTNSFFMLIGSWFLGMVIRAIITLWRVIPFT